MGPTKKKTNEFVPSLAQGQSDSWQGKIPSGLGLTKGVMTQAPKVVTLYSMLSGSQGLDIMG